MILDAWFWAGLVIGAVSLAVCVAMTAIRRHPADSSILSVAAVELFLLVYAVARKIDDSDPDALFPREASMAKLKATALSKRVPDALPELAKLGRTLTKRATDVLAFLDRPGTSNGPTEAINGRLEHLRGSALGFRNLTHYIARSLLEAGGFRPQLHPQL